jgi:hypothetical protein
MILSHSLPLEQQASFENLQWMNRCSSPPFVEKKKKINSSLENGVVPDRQSTNPLEEKYHRSPDSKNFDVVWHRLIQECLLLKETGRE